MKKLKVLFFLAFFCIGMIFPVKKRKNRKQRAQEKATKTILVREAAPSEVPYGYAEYNKSFKEDYKRSPYQQSLYLEIINYFEGNTTTFKGACHSYELGYSTGLSQDNNALIMRAAAPTYHWKISYMIHAPAVLTYVQFLKKALGDPNYGDPEMFPELKPCSCFFSISSLSTRENKYQLLRHHLANFESWLEIVSGWNGKCGWNIAKLMRLARLGSFIMKCREPEKHNCTGLRKVERKAFIFSEKAKNTFKDCEFAWE